LPFAAALRETLQRRGSQIPSEFTRGDSLELVLDRHLLAIEQSFDRALFTSILLLSDDGKQLSHGSAPNLPRPYREAIDGLEIGRCAGSCGTAAYLGQPVYVSDIATDPLWADYRHIALSHGLRSCWSTPIRDAEGTVIGTFAIYHRTVGSPSPEEIEAIDMITEHVSEAIIWSRAVDSVYRAAPKLSDKAPRLTLVADNKPERVAGRLLAKLERLEKLAAALDTEADSAESEVSANCLRAVAEDSRRLSAALRRQIELFEE
jgi:GAF domain-containing protein